MAKLFLGVPVIGHMEGLWIGNDNGWRSELLSESEADNVWSRDSILVIWYNFT